MLIEFTVKNFRSIKDQQTLSLVQAKNEERNSFTPDIPQSIGLKRSLAIYGANSAGKSNILLALQFFKLMVINSSRNQQSGEEISVQPFLFDSITSLQASEFEMTFISNNVKYQYGFATTKIRITEEWLFAFPKGRPQEWFHRVFDSKNNTDEYKFGHHLSGQKQSWKDATRQNALFLSTAVQLNSDSLSPIFDWFQQKLSIFDSSEIFFGPTLKFCEDSSRKNQIIKLLNSVNIKIEGIEIHKEKFDPNSLRDDIPKDIREKFINELTGKQLVKKVEAIHTTNDNKSVNLDFDEESEGTKKFFALAGPWIKAIEEGKILVIDELHNSLHPKLVKYLIDFFHNEKFNNNAQLIFTTHDVSILSQELFARDQIWFCEKNQKKATILYPLTDFSPRKNNENLEQKYMSGRYGAIPIIQELQLTEKQ